MKRHTRELRHLSLAFLHYLLELFGAKLASISANKYAIFVVVWHYISPFHVWSYGNPGARSQMDALQIMD